MKYKKIISVCWILFMLISSGVSFYLGIKNLNFISMPLTGQPLNKINFSEDEWRSFVSPQATLDFVAFKNLFLRKLDNKKQVSDISFESDQNKVVVNISHDGRQYKWFYNLVQDFVI